MLGRLSYPCLPLPSSCSPRCRGRMGGDFFFGRGGGMPFSGWSTAKLRLDARIVLTTGSGARALDAA